MSSIDTEKEKKYNKWIIALSIIIPVAVAALFGINLRQLGFNVEPLTFLPPIYATVNGITAIVLIIAVVAIKNKNRNVTRKANEISNYTFRFFLSDVCCVSHDK